MVKPQEVPTLLPFSRKGRPPARSIESQVKGEFGGTPTTGTLWVGAASRRATRSIPSQIQLSHLLPSLSPFLLPYAREEPSTDRYVRP